MTEQILSELVLQSTIDGLQAITRREMCVLDRTCRILAGDVFLKSDCDFSYLIDSFMQSAAEGLLERGCQHFKVFDAETVQYVLAVRGEDDEAYRIGKMAAFQLQGLVAAYKERLEHAHFVKQILLGKLSDSDAAMQAKQLQMDKAARRVVFAIQTSEQASADSADMVQKLSKSGLLKDKKRDFVLVLKQNEVIFVKELAAADGGSEIAEYGQRASKALANARIGASTICTELGKLACAYAEAATALEIGIIFDKNVQNPVTSFDKLGVARLIYNTPPDLSDAFVNEVLQGNTTDFDEETLVTVDKFFANNLNVSEAARQLYIHRNTLVYRLDKLQKMTGLDIRNFDDAVTLRLALSHIRKTKAKNC